MESGLDRQHLRSRAIQGALKRRLQPVRIWMRAGFGRESQGIFKPLGQNHLVMSSIPIHYRSLCTLLVQSVCEVTPASHSSKLPEQEETRNHEHSCAYALYSCAFRLELWQRMADLKQRKPEQIFWAPGDLCRRLAKPFPERAERASAFAPSPNMVKAALRFTGV